MIYIMGTILWFAIGIATVWASAWFDGWFQYDKSYRTRHKYVDSPEMLALAVFWPIGILVGLSYLVYKKLLP